MTIEELELRIESDAQGAATSIDKLTESLGSLKGATSNSAGLGRVVTQMEKLNAAAGYINMSGFSAQINSLVAGLRPLESLGKNNLTSFVTQLGKLPALTESLGRMDMGALATGVQRVADAMKPLAAEMEKISMGFSAMPKRLQSFITQMDKSGKTSASAAQGYRAAASGLSLLNQKLNVGVLYAGIKKITNALSQFVDNSNQYIEDLNLFTVSMGEYADAAYEYAQKAQDLMGIDAGQFMRNQGYFKSIASGFGVASDAAATMSQNLSQLGYDLASFYNSDVETAMTKLQSGLAGELEPLRRWGFALDQATLQEVALSHGIQGNIRDMNQAQKSMIRYIAIMEQSTNAQHDMARTLETPANAMRVLSQQVTLLGRSIGNLLIPMLSAILPYAIAGAKALRMLADTIAGFFGVSLPTIDYNAFSGLSVGASDAEDLADSLGAAGAAAKKLKDYVMGFDELNIISPDTGSGGGAANAIGGGFEGLELPSYDFLDGLSGDVDKILKKFLDLVGKVKKALDPLMPLLEGIAVAITTAFIVSRIAKWVAALKASKVVGPTLAAITKGMIAFDDAFAAGYSTTQSLNKGLEAFRASLTPLQTLIITVAALAFEFVAVYSSVKDATLGLRSWGSALTLISVATVLTGAVLFAVLGPIGLVATAVTGLTAAVLGYSSAQKEIRSSAVEESFFDGQGVAVGALADEFVRLMDSVTNANQPIIDGWNNIQKGQDAIQQVVGAVNTLTFEIDAGVTSLEDAVPEYRDLFQSLVDQTTPILKTLRDNVMFALAGSWGDSLAAAGYSKQEYAELVTGLHLDTLAKIEDLKAENENFFAAIESGAGLTDDEFSKMIANYDELSRYSGVATESTREFGTALERALVDVDFGSLDEVKAALEDMGESHALAKQSVYDYTDSLEAELSQLKLIAEALGQLDRAAELEAAIGSLQAYEVSQLNAIDSTLTEYMNVLQTNLANEMQDVWNTSLTEFDSLSAWQQAFYGSAEGYAAKMISTFQTDIVDPFVEAAEAALGVDAVWIGKITGGLVDGINNHMRYSFANARMGVTMQGSILAAVSEVETQVPGLTETLGQSFVDGFLTPIETADAFSPAADLGTAGVEGLTSTVQPGSPSKVTTIIGQAFKDGFLNPISESIPTSMLTATKLGTTALTALEDSVNTNASGPIDAFKAMLNEMISALNVFSSSVASGINDTLSSVASTAQTIRSSGRSLSYTGMASTQIPMLASGGIVSAGQVFVAREPGAGPELVGSFGGKTGVMNNDQIVSAVSAGVYEAVSAAMAGQSANGNQPTIVQIDGRTLLEALTGQDQTYGYAGFRGTVAQFGR